MLAKVHAQPLNDFFEPSFNVKDFIATCGFFSKNMFIGYAESMLNTVKAMLDLFFVCFQRTGFGLLKEMPDLEGGF